MKKHMIHVLELKFAHTTKIEHATEHKPNSRGATRLTARERPWSTNRCRGRSHKVLKVRLPEELEEARVLEEGDVRGAACGTEVSLLAAGGWRKSLGKGVAANGRPEQRQPIHCFYNVPL